MNDGAQLLRDMITRKITPDVITFSALIDIFVKEGKLLEAKELYKEMITRGISPDTITYSSLIYMGFARRTAWMRPTRFWIRWQVRDVFLIS